VVVRDRDSGGNGAVECAIDDMVRFRLEPLFTSEYKIMTRVTFDREECEKYRIVLRCVDDGQPPRSASRTVDVVVRDENDHSPVIGQSIYEVRLEENNTERGVLVVRINATDADSGKNGELLYQMRALGGTEKEKEETTGGAFVIDSVDGQVNKGSGHQSKVNKHSGHQSKVNKRNEHPSKVIKCSPHQSIVNKSSFVEVR